MFSFVLRGITTALLVTVLTLFAGIIWGAMGLGGLSVSGLLDIGLLASCSIGGYRTAKESGEWLTGGITGAGYVTVGTLLLALFLPIRSWGFVQVLAEGAIIGLVAGALGAGGTKGRVSALKVGTRTQPSYRPYYAGYGSDEQTNSNFEWDTEDNLQKTEQERTLSKGQDLEDEHMEKGTEQRDSAPDPEVEWPWDNNYERVKSMEIEPVKLDVPSKPSEGRPWWE